VDFQVVSHEAINFDLLSVIFQYEEGLSIPILFIILDVFIFLYTFSHNHGQIIFFLLGTLALVFGVWFGDGLLLFEIC